MVGVLFPWVLPLAVPAGGRQPGHLLPGICQARCEVLVRRATLAFPGRGNVLPQVFVVGQVLCAVRVLFAHVSSEPSEARCGKAKPGKLPDR